jgi:hypothetical protein
VSCDAVPVNPVPEVAVPASDARTIVLVEGTSDQRALETLADRRGRDLAREGVAVVAMDGASNIRQCLERFGPHGSNVRLAGLCDQGEVADFRRGLERAGLDTDLGLDDMEALGFFVCVADLEDELIRALGVDAVEAVIEAQGEMGAFRTLQKQAAQQARTHEAQLRRFMGTRGGRKIRYARLLVDALDPAAVPRPLDRLLAYV